MMLETLLIILFFYSPKFLPIMLNPVIYAVILFMRIMRVVVRAHK